MRTRITLYLIAFCMNGTLWAQCNIAVTNAYSGPSCVGTPNPQPSGFISLNWTGGTAPFTISWTWGNYQTSQHAAFVDFPVPLQGPAPYTFWGNSMQYTITDAMGCQSSGNCTLAIPFPWTYDDALNSFAAQTTIVDPNAAVFSVSLYWIIRRMVARHFLIRTAPPTPIR
ncbi:MAG: hypothetical protein IPP33_15760 [Flavobacteriales bacterium]|nr:hypothetical protein [Flavobacteriales bacterium]